MKSGAGAPGLSDHNCDEDVWRASKRRGGGCTYYLSLAARPAAVGGGERGRARLAVPWNVAILCRRADRQCVDTVGVAITIARVPVSPPVSRRPNKDGTLPLATLKRETETKVQTCVNVNVLDHHRDKVPETAKYLTTPIDSCVGGNLKQAGIYHAHSRELSTDVDS